MNPKILLLASSLAYASVSSAFVVTIETSGVVEYTSDGPFFDSSVEKGVTTYSARAMIDTGTMVLREFVDYSNVDSLVWSFSFNVDGLLESAFGNYAFSSSTSRLIVQVGYYAWSLPNEYDIYVGIETFVSPENPESAELYWSTTPFTRDGVNFKELWEEAPQVYFGGSVSFNGKSLLADLGVINEDWLRDELWNALVDTPNAGGHTMFAGSYADDDFAFGLVGGYAGPWNGGIFEYSVSKSLPEVSVPDSGATFAMLGIGLVGLLALRRRR